MNLDNPTIYPVVSSPIEGGLQPWLYGSEFERKEYPDDAVPAPPYPKPFWRWTRPHSYTYPWCEPDPKWVPESAYVSARCERRLLPYGPWERLFWTTVMRYRELAEIDTETWHRCPPDSFYWYINGDHEVTYITEPPFPFERRRRQATSYVELHSW